MKPKPSSLFMIRPANFGFNSQTADSNFFQKKHSLLEKKKINALAQCEFDEFVNQLKQNNIRVKVYHDNSTIIKPDAIFPNNWISFHPNKKVVLYPMLAPNRRNERLIMNTHAILKGNETILRLDEEFEKQKKYLEGTGSMVFDYKNKIVYANFSKRTNIEVLNQFCNHLKFTPVCFKASDLLNRSIYHTNVMMSIGNEYAVVCVESIKDKTERKNVVSTLRKSNLEIIKISLNQLSCFVGNMYHLYNRLGKSYILMSKQAFDSLTYIQKNKLFRFGDPIIIDIKTIEKFGGGGVRCMIVDKRY